MSSYTPATKLSYGDAKECATVLSDGNVMVTMANGAPWRQMMKLTDWLILADGRQVSEDFIPLSAAAAPLAPMPYGTKFRWTLNPETYRVSIMTAKGVLQVKSITDGGGEMEDGGRLKKKMFADEAAWRASLPSGGMTSLSLPDTRDSIQKRAAWPLLPTLTDVQKVSALLKRFKIVGACYSEESYNQRVERITGLLIEARAKLNALPPQELIGPKSRELITNLNYWIRWLTHATLEQTIHSAVAAVRPITFKPYGTGKFFAQIGGKQCQITTFNDRIVVKGDRFKTYANFAEAGVDNAPSGKPILSVLYRRRTINL
jgi:hypothetical protein